MGEHDKFLKSDAVRKRYGGVSDMWLYRRASTDPDFPKPIVIGGRKFWKLADLERYENRKGAEIEPEQEPEASGLEVEPWTTVKELRPYINARGQPSRATLIRLWNVLMNRFGPDATLEEIAKTPRDELLKLPHMGPATYQELKLTAFLAGITMEA